MTLVENWVIELPTEKFNLDYSNYSMNSILNSVIPNIVEYLRHLPMEEKLSAVVVFYSEEFIISLEYDYFTDSFIID